MSKTLWITVGVVAVSLGGLVVINQISKSREPIIGVLHASQGRTHIERGAAHVGYNSEPASSGPHYQDALTPAQWGIYITEVAPEVFIHNEEHGGVIVTYQPDLLPQDQLKKLRALFAQPYSNKTFSPVKAIIAPRAKNTHAIQIASWLYTLDLDKYVEATIIKYFKQHAGDAPEPSAGPYSKPINQAA